MIDIRDIPVIYINMDKDIMRRTHMENTLAKNGFKNYKRLSAYTTDSEDIYHAAFTSHARACHSLLKESEPFGLVLEDDVMFTDIQSLNTAINDVINNEDFELFSITHSTEVPLCYTPPRRGNFLAHFILYKRERIPSILVKLYNTWLMTRKTDIWELYGPGAYMYTGRECIQLSFYFPTANVNGNCVKNIMALCLFTEDDIEGKILHELIEKYTDNTITVPQLTMLRNVWVRVYKYHKGDDHLGSLNTLGNVNTIYLPTTLREKFTDITNKYEACKYTLMTEGIVVGQIYGYDNKTKQLYALKP